MDRRFCHPALPAWILLRLGKSSLTALVEVPLDIEMFSGPLIPLMIL
jgi:hypothetical protein